MVGEISLQEFLPKKRKVKQKKKFKIKKERALVYLGIILTLFFVVFSFINITKEKVNNWLVKLEELEVGEVTNSVLLDAIVIKEETVLVAPVSGELEALISEGNRIGVSGMVAKVRGGYNSQFDERADYNIIAPTAGLVSYEVDGFEQMLTRENYSQLDLAKLSIDNSSKKIASKSVVDKGEPVGKIINNLQPVNLFVFFAEEKVGQALEQGQKVKLKIGDSSVDMVTAKVIHVEGNGDRGTALLELQEFQEELYYLRKIQVELILEHYRGLIVNERAIIYQHDEPGLMIVDKNNSYKWQPVSVKGQINSDMVISGLNSGTSYIVNPR